MIYVVKGRNQNPYLKGDKILADYGLQPYFLKTLKKAGYLVQISDRQAWNVDVDKL